ncbi:hypothetical protein ACFQVC_32370 [Streptomyces monticola]|uniref:Uncharacterized protein n=1 Tax=Streptomyces monticola TaxID=2666263 RepID=A0ABW2JT00_9ACTN
MTIVDAPTSWPCEVCRRPSVDTDHGRAVILLGHTLKTVTVLQVSYLG